MSANCPRLRSSGVAVVLQGFGMSKPQKTSWWVVFVLYVLPGIAFAAWGYAGFFLFTEVPVPGRGYLPRSLVVLGYSTLLVLTWALRAQLLKRMNRRSKQ